MTQGDSGQGAALPAGTQVALVVAVALNAAGAMTVEITAGRLLAPYFGMSLYTWTTIIGVVLAGLTAGHWLGGVLADRFATAIDRAIALAFLAGAITTLAILPITRSVSLSMTLGQNPLAFSIVVTSLAAFFLPSLAAGVIQPLATTYVVRGGAGRQGRIIGRMLAAGAFGSIVGTFLAGFVFISFLGSAGTIWLVAGINALLAGLFVAGPVARLLGVLLAAAAGVIALTGWNPAPFATPCQVESRYYCIRIDPADRITDRPSRLMALDHLVHSINDEKDAQYLASPYVQLVDEIARRKFGVGAMSAFFVGGGGYTLPRAWNARFPSAKLVVAEIDPVVTALAEEKLWFRRNANVSISDRDARFALAQQPGARKFDVIFGDAFHDIAVPAHLVTDEFHRSVAARLTERGFYVINLVDNPRRPRLLASVFRTLRARFADVEIWGAPEDLNGSRRGTFILYASNAASGLPKRFVASYGPEREWWRIGLEPGLAARLGILLTDDFAPVDRLLGDLWLTGD